MAPAVVRARPRPRSGLRVPSSGVRIPRRLVIVAIVLAALATLYGLGVSSFEVYRLNREAARLQALKRSLQEQNAFLREEMARLQTPRYIEQLAREQLGLIRPGEVAILILQAPPTPAPARIERDTRSFWQRLRQGIGHWFR